MREAFGSRDPLATWSSTDGHYRSTVKADCPGRSHRFGRRRPWLWLVHRRAGVEDDDLRAAALRAAASVPGLALAACTRLRAVVRCVPRAAGPLEPCPAG